MYLAFTVVSVSSYSSSLPKGSHTTKVRKEGNKEGRKEGQKGTDTRSGRERWAKSDQSEGPQQTRRKHAEEEKALFPTKGHRDTGLPKANLGSWLGSNLTAQSNCCRAYPAAMHLVKGSRTLNSRQIWKAINEFWQLS